MNDDFFDRLEAELGGIARQGMHLEGLTGAGRRRAVAIVRRGAVVVVLAFALAASLVSEFASAHGRVADSQSDPVRGL